MTERTWTGKSGTQVYLFEDGPPGGAPVLLLHSSGLSGGQWRRTVEALVAAGRRVLVPDFLGHGKSEPWPAERPFRFAEDVTLLGELLGQLPEGAHLVGHSYGGFVGLQAALASPEKIRSLALFDPVAFGALDPERDADARAQLALLPLTPTTTPEDNRAWLQAFVDYWSGDGAWLRLREPARAEFVRVGRVVERGAQTLVEDFTPARAYELLAMPALLMTGTQTPLAAQRVVERLAEALPQAHLHRVAGAGHMGPLTHAADVNALLLHHLRVE